MNITFIIAKISVEIWHNGGLREKEREKDQERACQSPGHLVFSSWPLKSVSMDGHASYGKRALSLSLPLSGQWNSLVGLFRFIIYTLRNTSMVNSEWTWINSKCSIQSGSIRLENDRIFRLVFHRPLITISNWGWKYLSIFVILNIVMLLTFVSIWSS